MSDITAAPKAELQLAPYFKLTSTGLQITGEPTYDEWAAVGETLKFLESSIQFALGDWLRYGERKWGEKYAQVSEETGRSEGTLRNYVSVANSVDLSLRNDKLTFDHHRFVAPLRLQDGAPDVEKQRHYLDLAAKQELPASKLRDVIKQDERQRKVDEFIAMNADVPPSIEVCFDDMNRYLIFLEEETDKRFDLVIADPPYNVTGLEWDKIGTNAEFIKTTQYWINAVQCVLKPQYNVFWFCSPQYQADIEMLLRYSGMPIQSRLIWHRRNMAMGSDARHKFIDSYEMIYHCGNRELNFPLEWSDARFDVQTFAVPQTNFTDEKLHPTQKPLELIRRLVAFGSYAGDNVLDPFAGSGTTGAACYLEGNRNCLLIEKDETYVKAATARLAKLHAEQSQAAGITR
jgi:site-specific DNA-methyltransferase (adenine-specific)